MLRAGKIVGRKVGNRWEIPVDQLPAKSDASPVVAPAPEPAEALPAGFTVDQFEAMTYLTARGVENWLKSGRLRGRRDASGRWRVDRASLDLPDVQRMLRKS